MKLFVLVRKDLTPSQQAVQAGHAIAEYFINNPDPQWTNQELIYLGLDNLGKIHEWKHRLDFNEIPNFPFNEPDLNNEITAIAIPGNDHHFRKLRLI